MCRMMAVVGGASVAQDLVARFRRAADVGNVHPGGSKGHHDGWGITYADKAGQICYADRSPRNAATDPAYPRAVARLTQARSPGVVLAHVRKASHGKVTEENAHPFIGHGYAFCHNGSVDGIAAAGESDSFVLFQGLLGLLRKGERPDVAIPLLAQEIDRTHTYTSFTVLLTDGETLWGFRRVGNDPTECADKARAGQHYTLGWLEHEGATVVTQETAYLGLGAAWNEVPDGAMLAVAPGGHATTKQVL